MQRDPTLNVAVSFGPAKRGLSVNGLNGNGVHANGKLPVIANGKPALAAKPNGKPNGVELNGKPTVPNGKPALTNGHAKPNGIHANGKPSPLSSQLDLDCPEVKQAEVKQARPKKRASASGKTATAGVWANVPALRWMRDPRSSAKILLVPIVLWLAWHLLLPNRTNPFSRALLISYPLADSTPADPRYGKGYWDFLFLAYYVVFFSFLRQSLTLHVLRPLARRLGIRSEGKLDRFAEQGYAIIYFSTFSVMGMYVMKGTPVWFFRTEHIWLDYPHWRLTPVGKTYHLLQSAYWLQQLLVLALRLEKPRKDFNELIVHHIVTLWLVWWSYLMNFTRIGNAIFITMDTSDVFLAVAKIFNYLKMERTAAVAFTWFVGVWTYARHYLNIVILWSIYNQWVLMGPQSHRWSPKDGVWATWWLRDHMFFWVGVIQLLNVFWYFLIWRILIRAVFGTELSDERSDDEAEEAEPQKQKVKANGDATPKGIGHVKMNGNGNGHAKEE